MPAMKKIKGAIDGLRNNLQTGCKPADLDIKETLARDNFSFAKIVRHGFPYQPTCMAFDPVQKLLAIGNSAGSIRIFGRPYVVSHLKHESSASVLQIQFLVNEGALISVCTDDVIHLWNFRQKKPEIVHSLQFQKEKLTCVHLPFQSKWLYVGTDRGNVHVVSIESFVLSGYVINWNKAIDVNQKTHPGCAACLSTSPVDESKLLIGFERGTVVLWDLKTKAAEGRFQCDYGVKSMCWHVEGKQFMCSHPDGSLTIWNAKGPAGAKAAQVLSPHARKLAAEQKNSNPSAATPRENNNSKEKCKPIYKVDWRHNKAGEELIIFNGGLPFDDATQTPSVSVIRGKSTTVLEMEHSVVTFLTLCDSPYSSEPQDPYAVAVLLKTDLVIVDLTTIGYPCFENPYPMDLHESPVTCCMYMADCPSDLIPAYYSVGSKLKRTGFSSKRWPISGGGEEGGTVTSYSEVLITGHADGSVKFWDATGLTLQVLYKLKSSKVFDKPDELLPEDVDVFAVQRLALCPESRLLAVGGQGGQVLVYKFTRAETVGEVTVLEVPITYSGQEDSNAQDEKEDAMHYTSGKNKNRLLPGAAAPGVSLQRQTSVGSHASSLTSEGENDRYYPLKVKGGPQKRAAGYQTDLVCLTPWLTKEQPETITALAVNSAYGLMAYGTEQGIAIVDIVQNVCVTCLGTPELYGSVDPYSRNIPAPAANPVAAQKQQRGASVDKQLSCEPESVQSPIERLESPATPDVSSASTTSSRFLNSTKSLAPTPTLNGPAKSPKPERVKSSGTTGPQHSSSRLRRAFMSSGKAQSVAACDAFVEPSASTSAPPTTPGPYTSSAAVGLQFAAVRSSYYSAMVSLPMSLVVCAADLPSPHDIAEREQPRSRSSSASSGELISTEAVCFLEFYDSCPRKNECQYQPSLWVGTSQGTILAWCLKIETGGDARLNEPIIVSPSGTVLRQKGVMLACGLLDQTFRLLMPPADSWKESNRDDRKSAQNRVMSKGKLGALPTGGSAGSAAAAATPGSEAETPSATSSGGDVQFLVACSERHIRVYGLPSLTCYFKWQADGNAIVVRGALCCMQGAPYLTCYLANGRLQVLSLPSLRLLFDYMFLPLTDLRVAKTIQFTHQGHGVFMCSPTELQKVSIASELSCQIADMLGDVFVPMETPTAPKPGFLKSLFAQNSQLDREELFGEGSGKASKTIARKIPGSANMDMLRTQTQAAAGNEIAKAKMVIMERGEKLSEVEDKTAQMMEGAKEYSQHANELLNRYKNKKWYQL